MTIPDTKARWEQAESELADLRGRVEAAERRPTVECARRTEAELDAAESRAEALQARTAELEAELRNLRERI